jgi:hypothetical protein
VLAWIRTTPLLTFRYSSVKFCAFVDGDGVDDGLAVFGLVFAAFAGLGVSVDGAVVRWLFQRMAPAPPPTRARVATAAIAMPRWCRARAPGA